MHATSGCDSTVNLDLTVTAQIQTALNRVICTGDSIFFDGTYLKETGQYSASYVSSAGCDSLVTLDLSVVDEIVNELEIQICEGESYLVNGSTYSESGVYFISLPSSAGCDSLIIFTLVVNPNYDITLNESICSGEFVEVNGVPYNTSGSYDIALVSSTGCDSMIHLNLEVNERNFVTLSETYCQGGSVQIGNNTYSETGIYVDSFQTIDGCDSIIILNLTINPSYDTTMVITICSGGSVTVGNETYNSTGIYSQTLSTSAGCDSLVTLNLTVVDEIHSEIEVQICNGLSYNFGNEILTEAGTYVATYPSSLGCDSVVTLNLSTVPVLTYSYDDYICEGQTYEFHGTNYSQPGSYNHTLQSTQGCDSIVTVNLFVAPIKYATEDISICEGESYTINNQNLNETGNYEVVFNSAQGCDSIVTVSLVVHPIYADTIATTICDGDTYPFDGSNLSKSGIYYADLISQYGCDSSLVLLLDVLPTVYDTVDTKICYGDGYNFGSQVLTNSGKYIETFSSSSGCDSVVTLNLEVLNQIVEDLFVQICSGSSYEFNGVQYSESTSQTATFASSLGCDSVVTLNLAVLDQIETFVSLDLCTGDQYQFGDSMITMSGIYADTLVSTKGCDSIATVELIFHPTYMDSIEVTICDGESFTLENQTVTDPGYHDFQLNSVFGCDSVITVHLIVIPTQRDTSNMVICQGNTYTYEGTELTESGYYDFAFSTGADCDSIVTINLTVLEEIVKSLDIQICEGGSFTFNDSIYTSSVQESFTFTSQLGCDSTVNFNLEVLAELTTSLDISICSGESYEFDNQSLVDSGTYMATYPSTQGCDSIVTLNLTVLDIMEVSIEAFICEGTSYNFDNKSLNESGTYQASFIAENGCDSLVTLNLSVAGTINQNLDVNICIGETFTFGQEILNASGEYTQSYTSSAGCDSVIVLNLNVVDGFEEFQNHAICPGESIIIDSVSYTQDTSISIQYVSSIGCDSIVFHQITVLPEIKLSTEDYIICEGEEVQIVLSGAEGRPIIWTPAGTLSCNDCAEPIASPISTTTYTVTVEGCNGKIQTAEVTVEVLPIPVIQAPGDVTISSGQSISLTATREEILSEVSWYQHGSDLICTGCESITVNPKTTTEYKVVASNSIGCQTEDNVIVYLEDICELDKIETVNAMTPNDDGVNDFLVIRNNGLSEVVLVQVFNRWGEIVFESQSIDDQWDGTFRGNKVAPGVFMFLVRVQCIGGKETKDIRGNVTVIR